MNTQFVDESKECEILINITHLCNLKCKYCFVEESLNNFRSKFPSSNMDRNTQDDCISFLEKYCDGYDRVRLHFYGGEPFFHFTAMQYISEKAKSSIRLGPKVNFMVTTNGTLIDKNMLEFLDSLKFAVLVSLDGAPTIHDEMRLTNSGKQTSQKVLETIKFLKNYRNITIGLSAVIHNRNRLIKAYNYLKSLSPGFIKAEYIRVNSGHRLDLDENGKRNYFQDLEFIAKDVISQLINNQIPIDYRFNSRVLQLWRGGINRREFCGAGSSVIGIAANGDIFPCTLLIGEKDCYLGNVREGLSPEAVRQFKKWHGFQGKASCTKCDSKYYCGGGCAAMWKLKGRGFCEYIKCEIGLAFYIYETILKIKPESFALMVSGDFYKKLSTIINNYQVTFHEETI